jgi:TPR repeat protein
MNAKRAQGLELQASSKRDAELLLERARTLALSRKGSEKSEALRLLRAASRMGSAEASYAIGTWYLYGRVVPKNLAEASRYFAIAARRRHPSALFDLAVMYERGQGVRKNLRRAFALYIQAADLGDSDAMKSVVRCVFHGIGFVRAPELGRLILNRCS